MNAILQSLDVALQPLVNLTTEEVIGYEALARPAGAQDAPAALFEAALAGGWIAELELAVARRAFDSASLASGQRLFLNVHPSALESRGFGRRLRRAVSVCRAVIEITEQGPIADAETALANVAELRGAGALFALDDFGSGYAHLRWLREIRPRFIKLAQTIAGDFERVPWRCSIVHIVQSFAQEAGCSVIAEGIETAETANAARALGVEFGQGYFFGKPAVRKSLLCRTMTRPAPVSASPLWPAA
ncbi:MAG TPA: EAL domain-containing protein [Thermoanaerobaculia bacterium]|jgi:EAL domain-containing protein (putative c-di-GMP-specific phosphodiesterase class I)